jgi:NitT/TauT family transport system ATP-binding protein
LNLEIRRGEFLSIVGPKGCGKSLLLRIIAGLSAARTGEVIFDATFAARRDKLGFVFRRPALLPWRSILGNLMLRAELDNIERKVFEQCVRHLLASMGLHGLEDCLPCKLQIEQAQRAAICHALVHKPSLVLMDDPLGCMDFVAREHAGADIQRLWMEGSFAVVFATGDVTEAVRLSDRVVLMYPNPGRILQIMAVGLPPAPPR